MKFQAESQADYMNFRCTECGGDIHVQFLGYDPAVPRFKFECRKCNTSGEFKMQFQLWSGLPQNAAK
jgi:hypothetical protein